MLYGLCDSWTARRQLIGALGGAPEQLDNALTPAEPAGVDPQARAAQIAALARALT